MHSRHHIFDLLHTSDPHAHSGCLLGSGREGTKTSGRPSEGALTESQPAALGLGGSHSVGETPLVPPSCSSSGKGLRAAESPSGTYWPPVKE